jgi:hypothetical protein
MPYDPDPLGLIFVAHNPLSASDAAAFVDADIPQPANEYEPADSNDPFGMRFVVADAWRTTPLPRNSIVTAAIT